MMLSILGDSWLFIGRDCCNKSCGCFGPSVSMWDLSLDIALSFEETANRASLSSFASISFVFNNSSPRWLVAYCLFYFDRLHK
uniref:Uncharacterized protein n=1 Tax=Arundo donax TaxID=35708 RepID=A0A0A9C6F0_ARUDO